MADQAKKRTPIRVLIVDDSAIYRNILRRAASEVEGVEVVGSAANGKLCLEKLKSDPVDLVILDLVMPEMDGTETLKNIKRDYPEVSVVVVSGVSSNQADTTLRTLELGALDFIPKPQASSYENGIDTLTAEFGRVVRLTRIVKRPVKVCIKEPSVSSNISSTEPFCSEGNKSSKILPRVDAILVGSSTGGPAALNTVISNLPENIGCPIFVVQHMPPVFTASLASNLDRHSRLKVLEAKDGIFAKKNYVYVAPGGCHMVVVRGSEPGSMQVRLTQTEPVHSCRPAVDVMFESFSKSFKLNIISIILTGMGYDGSAGVGCLQQTNKCISLVQDERSCVVYGMPKKVVDDGRADEILSIEQIAPRVTNILQGQTCLV